MDKINVPLEVAQRVLWHFGDTNLGLEPGGFWTLMFRAWDHADQKNRARAAVAWPAEAAAFFAVKSQPWGLEWLRKLVKAAEVGSAPADDLLDARGRGGLLVSALDAAVDSLQVARNASSGVLSQAKFAQALAEATVALAEQQRIANRIALNALVAAEQRHYRQHGARVNLTGPEGVFTNEFDDDRPFDPVTRLAVDIREGLGL